MNTSDLSVIIGGLEIYTEYNVTVSAVTILEGPSASMIVRTDSDGECRNIPFLCTGGGGGRGSGGMHKRKNM